MIYFIHRNFKVKNGEMAYLLFQSPRRRGSLFNIEILPYIQCFTLLYFTFTLLI